MSQLSLSRSPYRTGFAQRSLWDRRSRSNLRSGIVSNQSAARAVALPKINLQFGPVTLIMALAVGIVLIGMAYLAHFNQVATKGYDLRKLEADRQQLLSENEIKDARLAQAKSMTTIISTGRISGMKKASDIIFVRGETTIASANTY